MVLYIALHETLLVGDGLDHGADTLPFNSITYFKLRLRDRNFVTLLFHELGFTVNVEESRTICKIANLI